MDFEKFFSIQITDIFEVVIESVLLHFFNFNAKNFSMKRHTSLYIQDLKAGNFKYKLYFVLLTTLTNALLSPPLLYATEFEYATFKSLTFYRHSQNFIIFNQHQSSKKTSIASQKNHVCLDRLLIDLLPFFIYFYKFYTKKEKLIYDPSSAFD